MDQSPPPQLTRVGFSVALVLFTGLHALTFPVGRCTGHADYR